MKRLILIPAIALMSAAPVFAEDVAKKEKKLWSGSQDFGYIKKDGNTESESLNAAFKLVYNKFPYKNTLKIEAANATSEDDTTGKQKRSEEKYYLSDKADYFLNERSYGFSELTYEDDHFSGYDYQSTFVVGYGYKVVNRDNLEIDLEVGPGYYKDEWDDGREFDGAMVKIAESLVWAINKTTEFGQELSFEYNDENKQTRFNTYLSTQLNESLAFKVTHKVKINDPDERQPGVTKVDRELIMSLVYKF